MATVPRTLLVDAHVHFYPCFDQGVFLEQAACNFATFRELEFDPCHENVLAWRERFAQRPSTKS